MIDFIRQHSEHFLCLALFLARIGDFLTTWFASPNLKCESNPIAKKLGWKFCILTVILPCILAYWNQPLAWVLLSASLCVCASNASLIWRLRTEGEEGYTNYIKGLISKSGLALPIISNCLAAFFYILLGLLIVFVNSIPNSPVNFIGIGIVAYGGVCIVWGTIADIRLHKECQLKEPKEEKVQ